MKINVIVSKECLEGVRAFVVKILQAWLKSSSREMCVHVSIGCNNELGMPGLHELSEFGVTLVNVDNK